MKKKATTNKTSDANIIHNKKTKADSLYRRSLFTFIINKSCAYVSDANEIFSKDLNFFKNLKYLVIDCLRFNKHPSHFSLDEVIKIKEYLKPKKTILTNMNNEMDYNYLCKILPKNIVPGYDGMSFYI